MYYILNVDASKTQEKQWGNYLLWTHSLQLDGAEHQGEVLVVSRWGKAREQDMCGLCPDNYPLPLGFWTEEIRLN